MINRPYVLTVPEVRTKLDNLITHTQLRVDNLEAGSRIAVSSDARAAFLVNHEHQLGRLHGLKEARELLDALESE